MEYLKSIFDLTKLPSKFFVLFSVISGFILFGENELLEKIKLLKLKENFGIYVGLVFLLSTGIVLINIIIWLFSEIKGQINKFKFKKHCIEIINNLDIQEKSILREFFLIRQTSIDMPIDDAVISGLLDKGILKINKQFGGSFIMTGMTAPVSINKIIEKYITFDKIDLPTVKSKENEEFLKNNRPTWLNKRFF
jgi:hypothetical protein